MKIGIKTFILKAIAWYYKDYLKGFNRIDSQGGFILYKIQPKQEYINILSKNKLYNKFAPLIRPIRNVFIHNPSIDIFNYPPVKDIRVVKLKKLPSNKYLNSIDKLNPNDLEYPTAQMNDTFDRAVEMINSLWEDLYKIVEGINTHDKFESLKYK